MCLAAALMGVIAFLRKQSLLGESLSHSTYPGVIIGALFAAALPSVTPESELALSVGIMAGAFVTALLGLYLIHFLERKVKVPSDSALCFILSAFFGIGLTLASRVQFSHTQLYKQTLVYLYGQAATMTDIHILIYGTMSLLLIVFIVLTYKELQTVTLDRNYATTLGLPVHLIDTLVFFAIVLAVVVGIRSVGVVLMSAMLIAPAVAARQYTHHLFKMFVLAALFGVASGFFGNVLSVELGQWLERHYPDTRLSLPTGPMIVLVAAAICVFSLLFAPERGLIVRLFRMSRFRHQCVSENLLKAMWRFGPDAVLPLHQIIQYQSGSDWYLRFVLRQLARQGWIERFKDGSYCLTPKGFQKAARTVRLHRLWEVYLADYLGVGAERVHRSAEEMEHIITPELEAKLIILLNDPTHDPHQQPIPPAEETHG